MRTPTDRTRVGTRVSCCEFVFISHRTASRSLATLLYQPQNCLEVTCYITVPATELSRGHLLCYVYQPLTFLCYNYDVFLLSPPPPFPHSLLPTLSGLVLGRLCLKSDHYVMFLCFLLLAVMLWVGYYYASSTCYYAWNLISD